MSFFKWCGAVFLLVLSAGCANHPFNAVNSTSYEDGVDARGNKKYSRVFAWDSKYTAGVGNSNGNCVQSALTARSSAFSAALEAVGKEEAAKGTGAFSFAEAVMALRASSVQTAYANAGYFYLCQIALNQSTTNDPLSSADLKTMWADVGDTAENIKLAAADLTSLSAPQLADIRTYLKTLGVPESDIPENNVELQEAIDDAVSDQGQGGAD
ncbi:MAG: hypothetical protein AB7E24_12045 [Novosphingobium sp.]